MCKILKELMSNNWSFQNYIRWKNNYPKCKGNQQSPINIDTTGLHKKAGQESSSSGNIRICDKFCKFALRYKPSKCHVVNKNNTITLRYDPNSIIKFKNKFYELSKISFHIPSMHTVNGENYDMEAILYHCNNTSSCESGVAISVFLQKGHEHGSCENFISQFINQAPAEESPKEKDIKVDSKWSAEALIPKDKSFYYYEGSLPHPPCDETWQWIIFEQPVNIGKTNYETFKYNINSNVRPVRPLKNRVVYYNSSYIADSTTDDDVIENENKRITILDNQKVKYNTFYYKHKEKIRGILITTILVLIVFYSVNILRNISCF